MGNSLSEYNAVAAASPDVYYMYVIKNGDNVAHSFIVDSWADLIDAVAQKFEMNSDTLRLYTREGQKIDTSGKTSISAYHNDCKYKLVHLFAVKEGDDLRFPPRDNTCSHCGNVRLTCDRCGRGLPAPKLY